MCTFFACFAGNSSESLKSQKVSIHPLDERRDYDNVHPHNGIMGSVQCAWQCHWGELKKGQKVA
jgi:hypothetical protein